MSILEIIWVLGTLGLIWLIVKLFKEDCSEFAVMFIIILLISLGLMTYHLWDFLTKPLWG